MKHQKRTAPTGFQRPKGKVLLGEKVKLRAKKLSDVRNDYKWQSDPELARLDAAPVLLTSFAVYLLDYALEVRAPRRDKYPLAVETIDGKHIGNCSCYDIDEAKGEAQLGIMIGDRDYWDKGYGTDTVNTLVNHIFSTTSLNRIYLKTLDWNLRAQKCFRNCGFATYGQLKRNSYNFVLMELKREQWEKRRDQS
jgi:RimJ/RimL family protein N-acetyltransferase